MRLPTRQDGVENRDKVYFTGHQSELEVNWNIFLSEIYKHVCK